MIRYVTTIRPEALEIHRLFAAKAGAEHISSPVGLHVLLNICDETRPKRVLEIGAGIGTLSFALLKYTNAQVDMIEDNAFCLGQLKKNLVDFDTARYTLSTDYQHFILPIQAYDLDRKSVV